MTAAAEPESSLAADLTWGATWPSVELFEHLAGGRRVIPVVRKLLADAETPIGIYRKLARDELGTFLLESAEHGGVWSRYSFIGAASRATLTERDGDVVWLGDVPTGLPTTGLAVDALRAALQALHTERIAGLPPLVGVHRFAAAGHMVHVEAAREIAQILRFQLREE